MLKLWRLVRRGGALETDHGRQTEAEGKPGEGSMSSEEGVFRREADGQGQDIHLVRLTTMGTNRYKKGSWATTAVRPGDLVEEMGP